VLRTQLLDSTRGRIVNLLRNGGLTADDLSSRLTLTTNAIRDHLAKMERDGVVRRAGQRPGTTRPAYVFELTTEIEQLLSQAYFPVLTHLVRVFASTVSPEQVNALMRQVGKSLAADLSPKRRPASTRSRVVLASRVLNKQLGAVTHVEANGTYVIRGSSCPLAALTGKHPSVCLAVESLVSEVVGRPAQECCDRSARPRCCFTINRS
jgi:predicted ArsR family transcriptional regulator